MLSFELWSKKSGDTLPIATGVLDDHTELGYTHGMSIILAAIGQLPVLSERVAGKREIFDRYVDSLGGLLGVSFMPEPDFADSIRWLTCLTIDPKQAGIDRDTVVQKLEENNIEARPTWKPMHMQPLYKEQKGQANNANITDQHS